MLFPIPTNSLKEISVNFGDNRATTRCHVGLDLYTKGPAQVQAMDDGTTPLLPIVFWFLVVVVVVVFLKQRKKCSYSCHLRNPAVLVQLHFDGYEALYSSDSRVPHVRSAGRQDSELRRDQPRLAQSLRGRAHHQRHDYGRGLVLWYGAHRDLSRSSFRNHTVDRTAVQHRAIPCAYYRPASDTTLSSATRCQIARWQVFSHGRLRPGRGSQPV